MWPSVELVGPSSVSNVEGRQHVRIRAFVLAAANHPKSLSKIARAIQPSIVAALRSWAVAGTINASVETKNVREARMWLHVLNILSDYSLFT